MKNRLKLYDDVIYTYIDSKDKIKFRKIAFKYKKSVSEFNRYLINLIIKLDESNKLNYQKKNADNDIDILISQIRGIFYN